MRNKLPVILAIAAATQWAPLTTGIIHADDESDADRSSEITESISSRLQSQTDEEDMQKSLHAQKKYLNSSVNLLQDPSIPSAALTKLSKRDEVYVLDQENGYAEISDHGAAGWINADALSDSLSEIFDSVNQTMYVSSDNTPAYAQPDENSAITSTLNENDAVTVTGISTESLYRISVNNKTFYVNKNNLTDHALTFQERLAEIQAEPLTYPWTGAVLNPASGSVTGPSGKETYYNLDMSGVISVMRSMGFNEADYPYWVRSDGAKMLGPYVMVAADLNEHAKGSVIDISLGKALVCDTGAFTSNGSGTKVDVAVAW